MAGALKHRERSHRSYSSKNPEFRRFAVKAIRTGEQRTQRKGIVETLKAMFHKHQDR
ncbi:MAG: hypothetical protein K0R34_2475 [Herbinix sp.]|jgi:hypothetical protein|nr:hypothetical protein [Herbinix sp.]